MGVPVTLGIIVKRVQSVDSQSPRLDPELAWCVQGSLIAVARDTIAGFG